MEFGQKKVFWACFKFSRPLCAKMDFFPGFSSLCTNTYIVHQLRQKDLMLVEFVKAQVEGCDALQIQNYIVVVVVDLKAEETEHNGFH